MNANIFRFEFRSRLNSVGIWSASASALVLVFFALFPSFASQADLMKELLAKFPKELLAAFGMGNMDLFSTLGFFSFLFVFVQICFAIQAGNYGFGLVSVEETEWTADFLLTKPVSRVQVLTSKILAAGCSMLLTDVIVWAASFLAILLFGGGSPYDPGALWVLLLSAVLFQLFFFSVGLVVSVLVKRLRNVTPYSLGLGFGMYILSAFSGIFGEVALEYITPFKHFDPAYIVQNAAMNTPLVLINTAISLIALAASYWLYLHRDIPAVS